MQMNQDGLDDDEGEEDDDDGLNPYGDEIEIQKNDQEDHKAKED